ncbi:hypothetical protein [Aquimarina longa]|uniref:hypothetical protein n=1 Tax=Aquimarina longa TaxID=1080221 RepID=UPI0007850E4F|nr:hypothetical protein [Aquimarina longa]
MKLKLAIQISFLLICAICFSQDFENELTSIKTIDNQIKEEQYGTPEITVIDRLVLKTTIEKNDTNYSKKEWRKIKKQLRKNKKRIYSTKNSIHTSKTIDTIYLNIPAYNINQKSRLSGW